MTLIQLECNNVSADSGAAVFSAVSADTSASDRVLDVDIYHAGRREHPESHIGWWKYRMPPGAFSVDIRLSPEGTVTDVVLAIDGDVQTPVSHWQNEHLFCAPRQDVLFVVRRSDGTLLDQVSAAFTLSEARFLKRFYERLHAADHRPNPFLAALHQGKLRFLSRLFRRLDIARGRILDIGSAYSVLTQLELPGDPDVFCIDIGEKLVRDRSREWPSFRWLVGDARALPYRRESFDAVFAGEIIEHFKDDEIPGVLASWREVLKPGGLLILTTPNRLRRLNRLNRSETPFGPDHFREFSPEELRRALETAGFRVTYLTGLYLELIVNRFQSPPCVDLLQTRWNQPVFRHLTAALVPLGRLWPSRALELIVVAARR